jgi:hypothetical protein
MLRLAIASLSDFHALFGQFLFCVLVLGKVRQAHATQDVRGFGELDIVIAREEGKVELRGERLLIHGEAIE